MSKENNNANSVQTSSGFFGFIEKAANKVPHPTLIFLYLFVIIFVLSAILGAMHVSVIDPAKNEEVFVVNLFSSEYIANFLKDMGTVFASFTPMLTVPLCALGMGVANHSGLLANSLKLVGSSSKSKWVMTAIVAFIGVNGNLAGDITALVYPNLVAMLYFSCGRNPIAGLLTAFCASQVGFGANVVVSAGDASLAGMTGAASALVDASYETSPLMGWYFMMVSTFILTAILSFIEIKWVEPSLNKAGLGVNSQVDIDLSNTQLGDIERKGLRGALIGIIATVAVIIAFCFPHMPFAAPEGKSLLSGPLTKCVAAIVFAIFFVPGCIYGKTVGSIKKFADIANMMAAEIKTLAPFYVVCFFASQFIKIFNDSKIAYVVAVNGGKLIQASGLNGSILLVIFIIMIAFINIFMTSASSKWSLLSVIFVPMLMYSGISPAAVQVAYRMGDGITNALTPISAALIVNLSYAQQYDKRMQLGTLVANNMKYCLVGGAIWILIFFLWCLMGLPVGPGFAPFL